MLPQRRAFANSRAAARPVRPVLGLKASGKDARSAAPVDLAVLVTLATLSASPAYADVDDAIGVAVDSVKAAGEAVKAGYGAVQDGAGFLGEAYGKISPRVDELVARATPYVKQAGDIVQRDVLPAAKDATAKAVPVITEGTRNLLKSTGIDVESLTRQADTATRSVTGAADKATPFVSKVTGFLSSSSPETLAKAGAALVVVYYLAPFFFRAAASGLRGYSGDVTPARAVDLVANDDRVIIIDIRSSREKGAVGVPDVPGSARGRFLELEMAEIERRLRGQLKNVDAVEAQVTALEIQALKRVRRNSKILLLDRTGGSPAKAVAKELAKLGFGSAFVIVGGFSGWTASKLQVRQGSGSGAGQGGAGIVANILGTIPTRKPMSKKP